LLQQQAKIASQTMKSNEQNVGKAQSKCREYTMCSKNVILFFVLL